MKQKAEKSQVRPYSSVGMVVRRLPVQDNDDDEFSTSVVDILSRHRQYIMKGAVMVSERHTNRGERKAEGSGSSRSVTNERNGNRNVSFLSGGKGRGIEKQQQQQLLSSSSSVSRDDERRAFTLAEDDSNKKKEDFHATTLDEDQFFSRFHARRLKEMLLSRREDGWVTVPTMKTTTTTTCRGGGHGGGGGRPATALARRPLSSAKATQSEKIINAAAYADNSNTGTTGRIQSGGHACATCSVLRRDDRVYQQHAVSPFSSLSSVISLGLAGACDNNNALEEEEDEEEEMVEEKAVAREVAIAEEEKRLVEGVIEKYKQKQAEGGYPSGRGRGYYRDVFVDRKTSRQETSRLSSCLFSDDDLSGAPRRVSVVSITKKETTDTESAGYVEEPASYHQETETPPTEMGEKNKRERMAMLRVNINDSTSSQVSHEEVDKRKKQQLVQSNHPMVAKYEEKEQRKSNDGNCNTNQYASYRTHSPSELRKPSGPSLGIRASTMVSPSTTPTMTESAALISTPSSMSSSSILSQHLDSDSQHQQQHQQNQNKQLQGQQAQRMIRRRSPMRRSPHEGIRRIHFKSDPIRLSFERRRNIAAVAAAEERPVEIETRPLSSIDSSSSTSTATAVNNVAQPKPAIVTRVLEERPRKHRLLTDLLGIGKGEELEDGPNLNPFSTSERHKNATTPEVDKGSRRGESMGNGERKGNNNRATTAIHFGEGGHKKNAASTSAGDGNQSKSNTNKIKYDDYSPRRNRDRGISVTSVDLRRLSGVADGDLVEAGQVLDDNKRNNETTTVGPNDKKDMREKEKRHEEQLQLEVEGSPDEPRGDGEGINTTTSVQLGDCGKKNKKTTRQGNQSKTNNIKYDDTDRRNGEGNSVAAIGGKNSKHRRTRKSEKKSQRPLRKIDSLLFEYYQYYDNKKPLHSPPAQAPINQDPLKKGKRGKNR